MTVHCLTKKCRNREVEQTLTGYECCGCGGKSFDGKEWNHTCKQCGTMVKPGKLVGLFVPYLCTECENNKAIIQLARGEICGWCRRPYCRCSC